MKSTRAILSLALIAILLPCGCATAPHRGSVVFNVRDYGAAGNGKHFDHLAINRAIDAAAAAGGGTVLVPAGTYLCGSIHLKSNIHLVIDAGAVILGAQQSNNVYDFTEPYSLGGNQDGGHCYFHNSLIWGENLTNVFITGHGMINGGGLVRGDRWLDRMCGFTNENAGSMRTYGAETNADGDIRMGNKAIALKLCRNVLIRDITIYHGGHFAILVTGCDDMTVDNVTMDTDRDGIDIDCCRNTTVSNCRVNSPNDDGICPKSTFALGHIVLTENLTIVNCQVSGFQEGTLLDGTMKPSDHHNGRIKFGTESSGGFRNCVVDNCTFRNCKGFALEEVDGGIMDDISVNNLTMVNVPDYFIYITTGKRDRTPDLETPSRGKNILISNVIADGGGKLGAIQILGLPGVPVEGVRLENIRSISDGGGTTNDAARTPKEMANGYPEPRRLGTLPAYGVYARHVKDLELANISTAFRTEDLRPAIICADVDGLEIDNFKPEVADGVTAWKFDSVTNAVVRNSPKLQ